MFVWDVRHDTVHPFVMEARLIDCESVRMFLCTIELLAVWVGYCRHQD